MSLFADPTVPVEAPAGYRWGFRESMAADALVMLTLVELPGGPGERALWEKTKAKRRGKEEPFPPLVRALYGEHIYNERGIRRASKRVVRSFRQEQAREARAAALIETLPED